MHAPFLDDIDLALILFNLGSPDAVAGVDYWLKQFDRQQCRIELVVPIRDGFSLPKDLKRAIESLCQREEISSDSLI